MPTIGELRGVPPSEPSNGASPKVKTPPSEATIQYPPESEVAASPTTGWLSGGPDAAAAAVAGVKVTDAVPGTAMLSDESAAE